MEFPRKHKWEKSETYNYVMKITSVSCEWMFQSVTEWLDQLDQLKFIYLGINISNHLDQRITDLFLQTNKY